MLVSRRCCLQSKASWNFHSNQEIHFYISVFMNKTSSLYGEREMDASADCNVQLHIFILSLRDILHRGDLALWAFGKPFKREVHYTLDIDHRHKSLENEVHYPISITIRLLFYLMRAPASSFESEDKQYRTFHFRRRLNSTLNRILQSNLCTMLTNLRRACRSSPVRKISFQPRQKLQRAEDLQHNTLNLGCIVFLPWGNGNSTNAMIFIAIIIVVVPPSLLLPPSFGIISSSQWESHSTTPPLPYIPQQYEASIPHCRCSTKTMSSSTTTLMKERQSSTCSSIKLFSIGNITIIISSTQQSNGEFRGQYLEVIATICKAKEHCQEIGVCCVVTAGHSCIDMLFRKRICGRGVFKANERVSECTRER